MIQLPVSSTATLQSDTWTRAAKITPLSILAVDDEPVLRQFLADVLSLDGHQVTITADAGALPD